MTPEQRFQEAKRQTREHDAFGTMHEFVSAMAKEAEAFRDMVHAAGVEVSGKDLPKILFSWEE